MSVSELAPLLTDDTFCDRLQLFAERGHGLDRRPFRKHWENTTLLSTKQTITFFHN